MHRPLSSFRLAIFDVDGTLKAERDPYMYLHRCLGTEDAGQAALQDFLAGAIDYDTFAQRDAGLWGGAATTHIDALFAAVPYIAEARRLATALREAGVPLVLLSSGLDRHVSQVAEDLGAARWLANILLTQDGRLTGRMGVRVPWDEKGRLARQIMTELAVAPKDCLAVGDGSGDLPVFAEAGYRIAVNPGNDTVRGAADLVLGETDWSQGLPVGQPDFRER